MLEPNYSSQIAYESIDCDPLIYQIDLALKIQKDCLLCLQLSFNFIELTFIVKKNGQDSLII